MKLSQGFTLVEAIVVISILAILAGIAIPIVFKTLEGMEIKATQREMETIYQVFSGDPDKGNYGFMGDLGILPDKLDWLVKNSGFNLYQSQSNGVGMGWNGPYLMAGFDPEDFKKDVWGNDYQYKFAYSNGIRKGTILLVSYGPDGNPDGGDDLALEHQLHTHRDIRIQVYGWQEGGWVTPEDFKGELFYSAKGEEEEVSFSKKENLIKAVHRGLHALYAVSSGPDGETWKNIYVGEGTTTVDLYIQQVKSPIIHPIERR